VILFRDKEDYDVMGRHSDNGILVMIMIVARVRLVILTGGLQ
jgi:hypothetical protein